MMIEYKKKYFKIYIWQALSILLGFASLFVVTPHLSSDKVIYGIYSVCTSLTIFFSYADLGFLGSGIKYAAEYYIKGDYQNEIRVVGFTSFFMIISFLIIDIGIVIIGFRPTLLIPELIDGSSNYKIAQTLLFTLAIGCPLIIAQRVLQVIFTIRVEDYKFSRYVILGSIIRIISVFYFFSGGRYMITQYYIFYQLVSLFIIVASLMSARGYGYKIKDFLKAFRFDKSIFDKEKSLSFASLLFMIAMILFNEIDQIAVSKMFGVESVAIYATAFSLMTFVRSYSGLVYSPFSSRYNHFVGLGDYSGLVDFTKKMVLIFSPILIVPIFNVALFSKPLVLSWVGENYIESITLVSLMVMSFAPNGITQPLTCYMTACENTRNITIGAILLPAIYWTGIILLSKMFGVTAFAIMKSSAPMLLVSYYWLKVKADIQKRGFPFVNLYEVLLRILPSLLVSVLLYCVFAPRMQYVQSPYCLCVNILFVAISVLLSVSIALIFNKDLRELSVSFFKTITNKL